MITQDINTDAIIDSAVQEALRAMNVDRIQIKQFYYKQIQDELDGISIYFHQVMRNPMLQNLHFRQVQMQLLMK